ncbi:HLA class II histocompatibility antigen gamma chain [Gracilinanus agilis]|uniref:HLA class II histocompatibility antigen gamma chain n=1 Tax=Gracilinanus agilis TaxID=191870 RepID=UPI001CFEF80B|nr:HLA class II histocompatibility antigen gamma chain [Gracilinanus agilis]
MEDQRDLISNHEQQPMLGGSTASQRNSCNQGAFYTGFSMLMALLIAGQAATIYFVYQQQGRLDKLTVTSQNLQLESLKMKLPKSAMPVSKLRMATPLLMRELEPESLPSMDLTKVGNSTTDQVKYLLQQSDPRRSFPDLTKSFQENLKHLKSNMDPQNWKIFESWMHQWLLFEMSKKPKEEKTETYQKVLTKCQLEASRVPHVHPGMFCPKCDENGNYEPLQCHGSTGFCWCVYPNGTEVPHTKSRGRHDCSGPLDTEEPTSSGMGITQAMI